MRIKVDVNKSFPEQTDKIELKLLASKPLINLRYVLFPWDECRPQGHERNESEDTQTHLELGYLKDIHA